MRSSPLENKTVRPGLSNYSFYASNRRQLPQTAKAKPKRNRRYLWPLVVTIAMIAGLVIGLKSASAPAPVPPKTAASKVAAPQPGSTPAAVAPMALNHCAGNNLSRLIKVSINARHMWACQGAQSVYDTPVVTGMEAYAADRTPTGTYHIYSKQTNLTLTGADSTGSWSDPVSYWMPFLSNQYGVYGFHDATWRESGAFGNIDPNTDQASHGCVELPLAASKWLYSWVEVGTTLTIES